MKRIYKHFGATVVLILALVLVGCSAQILPGTPVEIEENLIANGSFEIVSVDWPDGFGRFTGAGTPVFAVADR